MSERPTTASEYHIEPGVGLVIDGKPFPWHVAAEGPMVEPFEVGVPLHLLWVPIIAEGYAPRAGRPDGERLDQPAKGEGHTAGCTKWRSAAPGQRSCVCPAGGPKGYGDD